MASDQQKQNTHRFRSPHFRAFTFIETLVALTLGCSLLAMLGIYTRTFYKASQMHQQKTTLLLQYASTRAALSRLIDASTIRGTIQYQKKDTMHLFQCGTHNYKIFLKDNALWIEKNGEKKCWHADINHLAVEPIHTTQWSGVRTNNNEPNIMALSVTLGNTKHTHHYFFYPPNAVLYKGK